MLACALISLTEISLFIIVRINYYYQIEQLINIKYYLLVPGILLGPHCNV